MNLNDSYQDDDDRRKLKGQIDAAMDKIEKAIRSANKKMSMQDISVTAFDVFKTEGFTEKESAFLTNITMLKIQSKMKEFKRIQGLN